MPPEGDCGNMNSQKTIKVKPPVLFYSHCNSILNQGHRGGLSRTIDEIHGARLNPPPDDYERNKLRGIYPLRTRKLIGIRVSTDTRMTKEKNGAVSTARMNTFVALPLRTWNLLRILNKMTEAVGYEIVSGWTTATDTRRIGHDGTGSRTPSKAKVTREYEVTIVLSYHSYS